MNKKIPIRTTEERKEYQRKWREEHKDELRESKAAWVKKQGSTECICDGSYPVGNKSRHEKTNIHLEHVEINKLRLSQALSPIDVTLYKLFENIKEDPGEYILPDKYSKNYKILDNGSIRICNEDTVLGYYVKDEYYYVTLSNKDGEKSYAVHELVAQTFLKNSDPLKVVVNHKNGHKTDNFVSNLEWLTEIESKQCSIKGKKNHASNTAIKQFSLETRFSPEKKLLGVFSSIEDAAKVLKMSSGHIPSVCNGKRNEAGGFYWTRVIELIKVDPPTNGKIFEPFTEYIITDSGKIYSKKTNIYLTPSVGRNHDLTVDLYKNGEKSKQTVHGLVAKLFLKQVSGKICINHRDGNKENNTVENLEWVSTPQECTRTENITGEVKPIIPTPRLNIIK